MGGGLGEYEQRAEEGEEEISVHKQTELDSDAYQQRSSQVSLWKVEVGYTYGQNSQFNRVTLL